MPRIHCLNSGETLEFQEGSTLQEILPSFRFEQPNPILAAKVNNVLQGLKYRVFNNRDVEFLDYSSYSGRGCYCRSLCFMMVKAARDLFPGSRLSIRRPVSKGFYCIITKSDGSFVNDADVQALDARMKELVAKDIPFRRHEVRRDEAIAVFEKMGYDDKVKLLRTIGDVYINYYTLDGTADYFYDALVPSTSYVTLWELSHFHDGILMRVPDRHDISRLTAMFSQPKTFEVMEENIRWNRLMGLETVGDVNCKCLNGEASDLIQVAEALQEKKIVKIAEEIEIRYRNNGVRVVLITGPTSSGKSTFCKRLSVQLKTCGLKPVSLSTDDYFVNRVETPLLPDGSYDFDNFDTVDHDYMQGDIRKLMEGDEIEVPHYNFVTGLREYNNRRLRLDEGSILLIEGIHALNPQLTEQLEDSLKFRIFINTITSIPLDDHNYIPTSDNRLLRRIVRDYNMGSFTALQTISGWPNVRRSEGIWIYPYQEKADVLFNSAYLVEFAVMRPHAEQILATVPKYCKEYSEACRLLKFLSYFTPVSDKDIPSTSMIRSFIGGSSL